MTTPGEPSGSGPEEPTGVRPVVPKLSKGGALDDEKMRALLGMVAHELRTPIQAILANAESMALMSLPPDAQSALQRMERSIEVVLRRLDSIAQYVRSSTTAEAPEVRRFQLRDHVQSVIEECTAEAEANSQRIDMEIDEACPYELYTDSVGLHQVLSNYLRNAVRHGDAGAIVVRCSLSSMEASGVGAVQISVTNPSRGVLVANRDAVWEPFVRSVPPANRPKGMGLGLAVVKLLASSSGWEVGLTEDHPDRTTFLVRIPT
jgi:signal transduction histidine kinase